MRGLSWNLRIVLGLIALVIILAIAFGIYYTAVRISRDGPVDVDAYPNGQLVNEEPLGDDRDHMQYVVTAGDNSLVTVEQLSMEIERFYRDKGFTCRTNRGNAYVAGIQELNIYIRSSCLLDRSHALGFVQTVEMDIQPIRTPYVYQDNNPQNQIIGGNELTGEIIIDIRRSWGNMGLLGG